MNQSNYPQSAVVDKTSEALANLVLFKQAFMALFSRIERMEFPGLLYMPLGVFVKKPIGFTAQNYYDELMTNGYNLFLDDVREPHSISGFKPDVPTLIARTSLQGRAIVEKFGCPKHIYLDYYLDEAPGGNAGDTSKRFLDYFSDLLVDDVVKVPEGFTYSSHSADSEKRSQICNYMKSLLEAVG